MGREELGARELVLGGRGGGGAAPVEVVRSLSFTRSLISSKSLECER